MRPSTPRNVLMGPWEQRNAIIALLFVVVVLLAVIVIELAT